MENASKALLIAGAVLIAILLISVGIKVVNTTSGTREQVDSNMESTAAATFNAQFLQYLSNNTSAANAKSLVSKVMANNARVSTGNTFSADNHQIYINLYKANAAGEVIEHLTTNGGHNYTSSQLQDVYNKISNTFKYKIEVTTGCGHPGTQGGFYNGYILCLSIKQLHNI